MFEISGKVEREGRTSKNSRKENLIVNRYGRLVEWKVLILVRDIQTFRHYFYFQSKFFFFHLL